MTSTPEDLAAALREAGFYVSPVHMSVSEEVAAAACQRSRRTLANWRCAGTGPPWHRRHGRVWYPVAGLSEWLNAGDGK